MTTLPVTVALGWMNADSWMTGMKPSNAKTLGTLSPCDDRRHALPDSDAHRTERVLLARGLELVRRGQQQPGAGHAKRVTEGDGAAVGIESGILVFEAQLPGAGQHLSREGFVELDDAHVGKGELGFRQDLLRRGYGSETHEPWLDASHGRRNDTRQRREPELVHGVLRGDQQRARAIVDARRVAGRHAPLAVGPERWLELAQPLQARVRTGEFVLGEEPAGLAPAGAGRGDGHDVGLEAAALLAGGRLLLGPEGELVLVGPADLELRC